MRNFFIAKDVEMATQPTSASLGQKAASLLMGQDAPSETSTAPAVEGVDDSKLEALFRTAMSEGAALTGAAAAGAEKLDLSEEEVQRFSSAFKKPEFREMFKDYLEEISNPDNRAEYEQYIRSQEAQNQVPQGRELMKPKAGFALKTRDESGDKIFINVCQHEKVAKPTEVKEEGGTAWSLPYSLGPARAERDNKGTPVQTYDICFHTTTLDLCDVSAPMKQMVIGMALDSVETAINTSSTNGKSLSRDARVLRNVTCVGGTPAIQTIVTSSMAPPRPDASSSAAASSDSSAAAATPVPPTPAAAAPSKVEFKGVKGGFLNRGGGKNKKKKQAAKSSNGGEGRSGGMHAARTTSLSSLGGGTSSKRGVESSAPPSSSGNAKSGPQRPVFTLVEQSPVEMGDFGLSTSGRPANSACRTRPKALVLRIKLPGLKSASGVDLDVADRVVKLSARRKKKASGGKPNPVLYIVEVPLSYPVISAQAGAKWDRATQQLTVTMPVARPATVVAKESAAESMGGNGLVSEIKSDVATTAEAAEAAEEGNVGDGETASPTAGQRAMAARREARAATRHTAWVESGQPESKLAGEVEDLDAPPSESLAESIRRQVAEVEAVQAAKRVEEEAAALERAAAAAAAAATTTAAAGSSGSGELPPFRWQQNPSTVAVLVEVANIAADSVDVKFEESCVVLSFECEAEALEGGVRSKFALSLQLYGKINPAKSRFDVADLNLALVLFKAESGATWPALELERASDAAAPIELEAKADESGAADATKAEVASATATSAAAAAETEDAEFADSEATGFVAASAWRGAKRIGGKKSVYMTGKQGLGYYVDQHALTAEAAAEAAAVAVDAMTIEGAAAAAAAAAASAPKIERAAISTPLSSSMMSSSLMFELD